MEWGPSVALPLFLALSSILKHPLLRRYFEGASLVFPNNPWEVNCNESHFSMLMTLALAPWRYDIYGVELGQIDDALVAILDPAITNRESWQSRSRLWRQMVHETYSHYYHLLECCDDIQAKDRNLLFDMLMDRLTCFLSTFKDCLDLAQQFQREVAALESPERLMPHAPKAARLLTTGLFDDGVVAGQFFLDALSALQSRIAGDDWSEAAIAQEVMAVHRSNTAREIRANVERRLSQFVRQSEKYLVSLTRRHYTDELDWIEPVVRYWVTP